MFVNEGRGDRPLESPMETGSPSAPALLGLPRPRLLDPAVQEAALGLGGGSRYPPKEKKGYLSDTYRGHAALAPGRRGQLAKLEGEVESEWVGGSGGR